MWNIDQDQRWCSTTNTWQHKLILFIVVPIITKTTANLIPTETTWLSKAMLWGKSKQKKEHGIGVATGASDVVSEVHYPNKLNSLMQQNANKNVKRNDNDNTKSHPNTKKRAPSVAISTPQVFQLKSHDALNVKNDNTKIHRNTKKRSLSVATSTPQVSQLKSPDALNVKRQLSFKVIASPIHTWTLNIKSLHLSHLRRQQQSKHHRALWPLRRKYLL